MTLFRRYRIGLVSALFGFIAFASTQSLEILNPRYIGFMWGSGDISSSFISWTYFRQSPLLQWPLATNPNMGEPWTRGILFTDTPPIFAIPLKYLLHGVSGPYQFTGLQILLSTCLLVYFTAKTLSALRVSLWTSAVGGLLVATSPFLMFRDLFHHYSLNILWVVTAGIYLVVRPNRRFPTLAWAALIFIALTWMPYFVVPVLMLWIPSLVISRKAYSRSILEWGYEVVAPLAAGLIALVIDGFWWNAGPSGDQGVGYYNANLLALINPSALATSSWSHVIPDFAVATDGQYEGFSFLGIGGVLLVVISVALLLAKPALFKNAFASRRTRAVIVSALVAGLSATAFSFDLGQKHLLTISLPEQLASAMSIFRSSGRFMLVVALVLLIGSIVVIHRSFAPSICLVIACIALIGTYVDSFDQIQVNRMQEQGQPELRQGLLAASNFIQMNAGPGSRLVFVPPEDSAYQWKMDILGAAALRNLPGNDAFVARPNLEKLTQERDRTTELFLQGNINEHDIWVVYPEFAQSHRASLERVLVGNCWISIGGAYLISKGACPVAG